jgi:hypothetical protein
MRLQSDAAQLQREMQQLQSQLQAEKRLQQSIEQQLRETQRALLVYDANQTGWQLGAVQLYHNRVLQAAPVRVSERRCRCCAEMHKFPCSPPVKPPGSLKHVQADILPMVLVTRL